MMRVAEVRQMPTRRRPSSRRQIVLDEVRERSGPRQLVRDTSTAMRHAERLRHPHQLRRGFAAPPPACPDADLGIPRLRPGCRVRDEHRHRDPPRDVQRPLRLVHRMLRAPGSALAIESVPLHRPPLKRSAIGACTLRSSRPASASHCWRSATAAGLW